MATVACPTHYSGYVRKLPRTATEVRLGLKVKPYSTHRHYDNRAGEAKFAGTTGRYFVLSTAYNGPIGSKSLILLLTSFRTSSMDGTCEI